MDRGAMFAPYRPLKFDVRGPFCSADECKTHPDLAAMQFNVKEVLGTSARVAEGERYVVRGEYTLPGTDPFGITPAVFERACGATAHLLPGKGRFETCTEILKLTENPPNGLGVVVANERAGKCEIVRWTILAE